MAELADAPDSKSGEVHPSCGFDPHSRYQNLKITFVVFKFLTSYVWGCSSSGRAPQWHCGGKGFDPPQLHQKEIGGKTANLFFVVMGSKQASADLVGGKACES